MARSYLDETRPLAGIRTTRSSGPRGGLVRLIGQAFIGAVLTTHAFAQAPREALAKIVKCAEIPDSSERLKCFDAAMLGARSALDTSVQGEKRDGIFEWFGFSRPKKPVTKPEDFGRPPQSSPDEMTQMSANVLELAMTSRGRAVFVLDNGQVWKQLDGDDTVILEPARGETMKITIALGLLGNYNLTVDGRNAIVRVSRLK